MDTAGGRLKAEGGARRSLVERQRAEGGGQKSEVRSQWSEVSGQRARVGNRGPEGGDGLLVIRYSLLGSKDKRALSDRN